MNRRFIFRMRPTICRRAKRGGNSRAAVAYNMICESEHLELLGFNTSYIIRMWHGHIHNSQYVSQNKDR